MTAKQRLSHSEREAHNISGTSPASSRAPLIFTSIGRLPTALWDGTFMCALIGSFSGSMPLVWPQTRIDPPLLTRIDPPKRLLKSATVLVG